MFSGDLAMQKYKILDHTADIGIEVQGKTRKELFANSAMAMSDLMTILKTVEEIEEKRIDIEGADCEDLMINFLREILYLFNGKGWLLKKCKVVKLTSTQIEAQLRGELYNSRKHTIKTELKAVTYHQVGIRKSNKGWQAEVIFDV
jgi:SHS2 domain-containing protein